MNPEVLASLKRCRCAIGGDDGWCGEQASQEDGLCNECRVICQRSSEAVVLTVEETLERDGVTRILRDS